MSQRVAVIGAGAMAREHIRAFRDIAGVSVTGIYSRTRERATALAQELGIRRVCSSIPELYGQTEADLVVIAVPELAARMVAETAFMFPWTIFMEKPPGYHLLDAKAIVTAAEKHNRSVLVGLNRRFLNSTQQALRDLEGNKSSRFIHVQDQQSLSAASSIGHPPEVVAHWMFANSIHVIDYLRLFGRGQITRVQPIWPWRAEQSMVVLTAIEFSSGDRGLYEGIWKGPGPWAVSVTTDLRRWEFRPLEHAQYQNQGERRLQAVEAHPWDTQYKPGFRLQAEEVIRAVRGFPSQAPTLQQAMETMHLIDGIFGQGSRSLASDIR